MALCGRSESDDPEVAYWREAFKEQLDDANRFRAALRWIAEYGEHDGDLLDHAAGMRNIALNTLLRTLDNA